MSTLVFWVKIEVKVLVWPILYIHINLLQVWTFYLYYVIEPIFFILHLLLKINFKGLMSIGFKIKRIVKKNVFSIGWEMTIGRLYRCVIQMLFDETRPPFFSTSYLSLPISQSLFHATEIWYRSPRWHTAPLIPLHIAPLFRSIYPSISPLSSSSPCSCFIWHMMRCHRSALE